MKIFNRVKEENANPETEGYFDLIEDILYITGLWPVKDEKKFDIFYIVRLVIPRIMLLSGVYLTTTTWPLGIYKHRHEALLVLEQLIMVFAFLMCMSKLTCILWHNKEFKNLVDTLGTMFHRSMQGTEWERKLMTDVLQTMKLVTKLYIGVVVMVTAAYVLGKMPLLLQARSFYFSGWYPYDETSTPMYEITLISHAVLYLLGCWIILVIDTLILAILMQTIAQFKILRQILVHIRQIATERVLRRTEGVTSKVTGMQCLKDKKTDHKDAEHLRSRSLLNDQVEMRDLPTPRTCWVAQSKMPSISPVNLETIGRKRRVQFQLNKVMRNAPDPNTCSVAQRAKLSTSNSNWIDLEMRKLLKECIGQHAELLRYARLFEKVLQYMFMTQLLCNLVAIAFACLYLTLMPPLDDKVIVFATMMVVCLLEMGIVCFLCEELREESSLVKDAIYSCDWMEASASFKKAMNIMMSRANTPVVIEVAGFVPLLLHTFVSVSQVTCEYYIAMKKSFQLNHA